MDSFFGIGIGELFFIALIALVVLGPERLPGAIREVSKYARYIRNLSSELTSQFSEEMKAFDDINPHKLMKELTGELEVEQKKPKSAAKSTSKPAGQETCRQASNCGNYRSCHSKNHCGASVQGSTPKTPRPLKSDRLPMLAKVNSDGDR